MTSPTSFASDSLMCIMFMFGGAVVFLLLTLCNRRVTPEAAIRLVPTQY